MQDRSQVPKVGLIADDHDDGVRVGVVAQLLQPALVDALERRVLRRVIDNKRADCSTVIPAGYQQLYYEMTMRKIIIYQLESTQRVQTSAEDLHVN